MNANSSMLTHISYRSSVNSNNSMRSDHPVDPAGSVKTYSWTGSEEIRLYQIGLLQIRLQWIRYVVVCSGVSMD